MNRSDNHDTGRRRFLRQASLGAAGLGALPLHSLAAGTETLPFGNGARELVAYPQKRPLLRVTTRPPHLETPFTVFNEGAITPNDAFFVRYHLANIPTSIDAQSYRLKVGGHVRQPLLLSLAELKALAEPVEMVAVNQCSGNSRGFSEPRVFGAQLGHGSMGNARWVGVSLRAVLEKAGVLGGPNRSASMGWTRPCCPKRQIFKGPGH